jgi:hypothetical protein
MPRKYSATVVCWPLRSKVRSLAPSLLSFLTTRGLGLCWSRGPCDVVIRKPVINRCNRRRSLSGRPWRGASAFALPGLPRTARARSMSGPGMYIAPVDISTLISMRPIAGRTDWKYPRHSTIPPPISRVSLSVKKDLTLKGYLKFGAMRTTTLSAYPGSVNENIMRQEK